MEFRYKGFRIFAIRKENKVHVAGEGKGVDIVPGYDCFIYADVGTPFEMSIAVIEMCVGYEVKADTESAFVEALTEYIDKNIYALDCNRKNKRNIRMEHILKDALNELDEFKCGLDLYQTFKDKLGLTEKEIYDYGFAELVPYFNRERYAECIAKELTDIGTLRTETGCWFFKFSEVSRLFGVQLPYDKEMLSLIKDSFNNKIVTDMDFSEGIFLYFDTAYCARFKGEEVRYDDSTLLQRYE